MNQMKFAFLHNVFILCEYDTMKYQKYFHLCFRFLEKLLLQDPELKDDLPISYMSHKELYEHSVRKAALIGQKIRELRNSGEGGVDMFK